MKNSKTQKKEVSQRKSADILVEAKNNDDTSKAKHPKCKRCGCIFPYLVYRGDDVVLDKKELELAIFARCSCGYDTVFLPNEVPENMKDDLNEA